MVWRDQVPVVTAAVRGIGMGIARRLAREGAAVCVNYAVRADAAETLVQEILAQPLAATKPKRGSHGCLAMSV
jgi:NAD(P)-dependent dehydrogenase (short-subunit alcohol dehydrogenase family)